MVIAMSLSFAAQAPTAATADVPSPRPATPVADEVVQEPEFQWSPVAQATSYRLQLALDHRFASIWRTVTTNANRYVPTDALPAGAYWWRVRAEGPNGSHSIYSVPRAFTRRWTVFDGGGARAQEVARPDNVGIEDFDAATPGTQVPTNALKIWWEPVADASHYEVQFDGDQVCTTSHTVITPNTGPNEAAGAEGGDEACEFATEELGDHWIRVRAVDLTTAEEPLYSIWSDQARSPDQAPPAPAIFTLTPAWTGPDSVEPAELTHPANEHLTVDAPVLQWNPVGSTPLYRVVIARDREFTNVVGDWKSANTRLIPTGSLWDHTAMRSYYWMVLPCIEDDDGQRCLNENQAVNRKGKFRSFRKQILEVSPKRTTRDDTPWTTFRWESLSRAVGMKGTPTQSVPALKWYEIQYRPQGSKSWSRATTSSTDVTAWMSEFLPFGARLLWRVRVVDGTGESHAWSEVVSTSTPVAVPNAPTSLRVSKIGDRLSVRWNPPRARYFPVTGYTLWYSVKGKRWKPLGTTGGTTMKLRMGSQKKFHLRVNARNAAGEGRPSVQARVR